MEILRQTVEKEVEKYAAGGRGANILLFAILDDDRGIYAVNAVDYPNATMLQVWLSWLESWATGWSLKKT